MGLKTKYAPAERLTSEKLRQQSRKFENNGLLEDFLTTIPAIFIIINELRQIVYLNNGALEFSGLKEVAPAIGKRPGELIGCIHSDEEEGGCGTSESCTYCGAVNAVLESQRTGKKAVMDCRLIVGPEENAYDLRVWASPLEFNNEKFTVVTIQDIRDEKWRGFLERIFFHDLLNIMTSLLGNIELYKLENHNSNGIDHIKNIEIIAGYLLEEIESQRLIMNAENDSLNISPELFNSENFLKDIAELYRNNRLINGKKVQISLDSNFTDLLTDKTILRRILGNMIKNALEASSDGDKVTIGCSIKNKKVTFWVHNKGFIPKDVQIQIFSRSFSTKGNGRGLGCYSMKLLSRFIEGEVFFSTFKEIGTTFNLVLPLK
ncbi:MAG: HAMP domain-containing histidine kinase [Promethearchaeota archaeon]|nr:MAG: HAMP domain-containing histidine kinase [Candidatus Lokiarchaeota archaeon]